MITRILEYFGVLLLIVLYNCSVMFILSCTATEISVPAVTHSDLSRASSDSSKTHYLSCRSIAFDQVSKAASLPPSFCCHQKVSFDLMHNKLQLMVSETKISNAQEFFIHAY